MLKQIALSLGLIVGSLIISSPNPYEFMVNFTEPMNFTTVADNEHYDWLP